MRYLLRAILAGGLGFAVSLVVAACGGGSGLLSSDQSSTLSGQLDRISSAVGAGNCSGASTAAAALAGTVGSLPASVNATLRNNLIQGASTVQELAQKDCHQTTSTPAVTTTPTQTVTTSTTASTTTTQSTTSTSPPTTSTSTSTPATTPTTPGTTSTGGTGGAGLGASAISGEPAVSVPGGASNGK
jgi:hypothetical protein